MTKATKVIVGLVAVFIILWFLYAITSPSALPGVVKIGFMAPLTGDAASYGESIKKGVDLAKKEMALANLEIIVEDSKCDGKEAVKAASKMINIDKVAAIIGDACSGATLAAAPVAEKNQVVMMSPASTSPDITRAGEYIFRVVPSDALQGDLGAKLVHKKGFKKLAVLYSNEPYGLGFAQVLKKSFISLGGQVVASESLELGTTDIRTQITKIKAANPEAIYLISGSPDSAISALRQIQELGLQVTIFGAEGLKSADIIKGAQSAAEGLIVASVTAGTNDFLARHKAEYSVEPGPFAAQGYDAFKALALVIKQGAKTGEEIKNALYKLSFRGATGSIAFDQNGDVSGNYDVLVVRNAQFVSEK